MTRAYALRCLLKHGRLRFREIVEITGWTPAQVGHAIENNLKSGLIDAFGIRPKLVYALVDVG